MKKNQFLCTVLFSLSFALFSQEALKSIEEEYYDFLSLQGITERPYLNYRTLSDSEWNIKEKENTSHPWKDLNLGTKKTLKKELFNQTNWFLKGINNSVNLKIYGPEWFNSFNTTAPYGQNDGALWQGKGYNTSLTLGARFEALGFEITLKPQVCFSQNLEFEYIKPNYNALDSSNNKTIYFGKAADYGYYGLRNIDAPQRFGNKPFWTFDLGDTEIRWSLYKFTLGFGNQIPWIGPAQLNPIIHSNNAGSYPKFDIGFRKVSLFMPHFKWHLGDIEVRAWWGMLSESEYFDNNDENNKNLISALSVSYSLPYIFKGLSIGFNRTMLSKWNEITPYSLFRIYVPNMNGDSDAADQRFSLTFNYLIEKAGLDIYLEWARNDFSPNMDYIIRYPYHTAGWTFGTEKSFLFKNQWGLKILLELTYLECSADYDRLINWASTFYAHHEITQGYTNKGQWLGAGIGTGGNSQYLGFKVYNPKGFFNFFIQRRNPDLDYTMYIDAKKDAENIKNGIFNAEKNIRCLVDIGLQASYFITNSFSINGKFVFEDEHNPLNINEGDNRSDHRYNIILNLGLKYNF